MEKEFLTEWLTSLLKGLVVDSESLLVEGTTDEQGILFTIKVGKEDRGRVIGKKGQTAEAIRTIFRTVGFLKNIRASMVIDIPGRKYISKDKEDPSRNDAAIDAAASIKVW